MEAKLTPKLLAKLDQKYQKTLDLTQEEISVLSAYYRIESRANYGKIATASFLATSCLLASRLGINT
jgi:hypothetical protein